MFSLDKGKNDGIILYKNSRSGFNTQLSITKRYLSLKNPFPKKLFFKSNLFLEALEKCEKKSYV